MATNFKTSNLGFLAFCPELNQGRSMYQMEASGGSGTTITVAAGSGVLDLYPDSGTASLWADKLNGLWAYFTGGSNAGNAYKITDTAWLSDVLTITTTTMSNTPSSGDTFEVYGVIAASGVSFNIGKNNITRDDLHRQTLDPASSLKGLETATFSFDAEVIGLETALENGVSAVFDRYSQLFALLGSRTAVAGNQVSGNSSTTTQVDVSSAAGFEVGNYVMISGEMRRVTATDTASTPDNITVSPALSSAPEDTTQVFGTEYFTPYDTGHPTATFLHLVDDQLRVIRGAAITCGISGTMGEKISLSIEGTGEGYSVTDPKEFDSIIPWSTNAPLKFIVGDFFFGADEYGANLMSFSLGQGQEVIPDTLENQQVLTTSRSATLQANLRNQSEDLKTSTEADGTQAHMIANWSSSSVEPQGNTVAVAGNSQIQDPSSYTNVANIEYYDVTFGFVDDQDATTSTKPVLIRA